MSLTTGASLITLSLLLNKVSGLYGLLALLTGFELNLLQLSMYIYSLLALGLAAYLAPYIRTPSPLHALALAWFYAVDSVINAAYTAAFGLTWFLVLAQHNAGKAVGDKAGPGAGTIDGTSGFTSPQKNVTTVHIVSGAGEDGIGVISTPASSAAGVDGNGNLGHSVLQSESMNSLGVIIGLWTIRLYFCVIMFSYARMVLRQHIALTSRKSSTYTAASPDSGLAENPFDESKPEGQGWKGKQGRLMVSFPKTYWLGGADAAGQEAGGGADEDVSWMQGMGGKFRKSGAGGGTAGPASNPGIGVGNHVMETGPLERERRRRSGTGPPAPSIQLTQPGQKGLSVPLQDL